MERRRIACENFVYAMGAQAASALRIRPGEALTFETCDCFHGQIHSERQSIDALDWERINPATGPVFVEGAQPGDALKVRIEHIQFTGPGVMAAIPEVGIFGGEVRQSTIRLMQVEGDRVVFGDGIRLPVRPMIGVIGVAPAVGEVPCGTPGSHGGNMDCAKIAPGSTVYLPVRHPGGLLAMGDVHACMGDGEIMGTGVEIAALIDVSVDLVKGWPVTEPVVETADTVYVVASAGTLERAALRAAQEMRCMVENKRALGSDAVGMLLSAAGSLEICQIVDPQVTVRFGLQRALLEEIECL